MGIVSQKLRDSARGQPCSLRSGYCNHDPETTVLAHLPSVVKGMGTKSNDWHAVFACSRCHEALDQHQSKYLDVIRAIEETQRFWVDNGMIIIAGDTKKPRKPSSKTVQGKSIYYTPDTLKGTIVAHDEPVDGEWRKP
jgi:hypothetical protein